MHSGGASRFLEGQTAIVTGAGRGIGRAISRAFARAGATVVLVSRTADELEKTLDEIAREGGRALAVPGDVMRKADVDAVVARALEATGGIDVLVNNAGVFVWKPFAGLEEPEWDRILGTNLKAAYLLTRAALSALSKTGRGRIVNISSIHGTVGDANVAAHCAAKFGLIGLTKALANELRGAGVSVNAVCPGSTENKTRDEMPRPHGEPLREKLNAEDVAEATLFLVSPAAAAITGAILDVWGGTRIAVQA